MTTKPRMSDSEPPSRWKIGISEVPISIGSTAVKPNLVKSGSTPGRQTATGNEGGPSIMSKFKPSPVTIGGKVKPDGDFDISR